MVPRPTPLIYSQLIANPEPNLVIQSNDTLNMVYLFPQENKALLLGLWKNKTSGKALTAQSAISLLLMPDRSLMCSGIFHLSLSWASLGLAVTILPR